MLIFFLLTLVIDTKDVVLGEILRLLLLLKQNLMSLMEHCCLLYYHTSLPGLVSFFFFFFLNRTLARVIWEKRTSLEELLPSGWLQTRLYDIF